ncbi:hypothetical protein, partial [Klebsiella quasipneumoniae]|uniref:hypothetical protein n=1 Tax=Klebsiella quasipneumoniae TaxID=1463165 RepID=UPI00351082D3
LHLVIEPLQSGTPFSVALPCSHRSIPESSDRPLSATKSEFSGTDCAKRRENGPILPLSCRQFWRKMQPL